MRDSGFTMIETVLSIVLVGILGVIAAQSFLSFTKSVLTADSAREATQANRLAMDRMVREIRNAKNHLCVATATADTFSFVDARNKTITFALSGGSVVRTEDGVSSPLVGDVDGLAFTYYNDADPPADITAGPPVTCAAPDTCSPSVCSATDIWSVGIDLTTRHGAETTALRSLVHPRGF